MIPYAMSIDIEHDTRALILMCSGTNTYTTSVTTEIGLGLGDLLAFGAALFVI